MYSSTYYYDLMTKYDKEKQKYEEKKKDYSDYLEKLNTLQTDLDSAYSDLVNSETYFKNGGYNNNGVTLDAGLLATSYKNLNSVISDLSSVIKKTSDKITEFETEIEKYTTLYKEAYRNYVNTKLKEMKENE